MFPSVFTDELGIDIEEALPIIRSWGLEHCDLRGRVVGGHFEDLRLEQLVRLRELLDRHGMAVGCLQSSLAKVHLPGAERRQAEAAKLEGIIRAADAFDCRLVRAFFYWQPPTESIGSLSVRPDLLQPVLDAFGPLAERARVAGLQLAFENCGVTPDEVFTVLNAVDQPSWGLAWDVNNDWSSEERHRDEMAYMGRLAERTLCVHVKARTALSELSDAPIPYGRVLAACRSAGLEGPVSVETHNPDRTVSDAERSHRVVQVIRRAWPSATSHGFDTGHRPISASEREYVDDPVGFVVVGLGVGRIRSREITQTPGTRLIGVCDRLEERAQRYGEEYGVPYTTDLRPWLENEEVEVVFVLTPTGRHAEVATPALEAGKHVLTTKPMEASLAACDDMLRLAERTGLLLAVDFDMRHRVPTLALRTAVAEGRFGRLLGGDISLKTQRTMAYFRRDGGWRGTKRWDGGGVLSNQNIHHLDQMAYAIGVPAKVRCNTWTQNHDIEAEDLGCAVWVYEDGTIINLSATTSYPQDTWYARLDLHGTEGAVVMASGGPYDQPEMRWYLEGAWMDSYPDEITPPWLNSMDNFAAAVRTGADLVCSGRDGRRSQAILDAMYRSADSGGDWIDVEPELD